MHSLTWLTHSLTVSILGGSLASSGKSSSDAGNSVPLGQQKRITGAIRKRNSANKNESLLSDKK